MPNLLHIQSSPNLQGSVTRILSNQFVEKWIETHENVSVDVLDLAADPVSHFGPDIDPGYDHGTRKHERGNQSRSGPFGPLNHAA